MIFVFFVVHAISLTGKLIGAGLLSSLLFIIITANNDNTHDNDDNNTNNKYKLNITNNTVLFKI